MQAAWGTSEVDVSRLRRSLSRVESLRSQGNMSSYTSSSSGTSIQDFNIKRSEFLLRPVTAKHAVISPECNLVAFHCPGHIYVYLLSDQDHPMQDLVSLHGWNWVSVSISGNYILARARVRESGATAVSYRHGV